MNSSQDSRSRRDERQKAANQRKIIIAVLLGMVGAAILLSVLRPVPVDQAVSTQTAETSDTESPASSTSADYETCVSKLGPGLERCLELPESMWESCRRSYLREMDACTS